MKLEANVVHHIVRHAGDERKFFNPANLQSLNRECHDRFAQSQERGGVGFNAGCQVTGEPLNKDSDWFR